MVERVCCCLETRYRRAWQRSCCGAFAVVAGGGVVEKQVVVTESHCVGVAVDVVVVASCRLPVDCPTRSCVCLVKKKDGFHRVM